MERHANAGITASRLVVLNARADWKIGGHAHGHHLLVESCARGPRKRVAIVGYPFGWKVAVPRLQCEWLAGAEQDLQPVKPLIGTGRYRQNIADLGNRAELAKSARQWIIVLM